MQFPSAHRFVRIVRSSSSGASAPMPSRFDVTRLLLLLLIFASVIKGYGQPTPPEFDSPDLWQPGHVPFSFKYDGKNSAQLLAAWSRSHQSVRLSEYQVERYSFKDPNTG